ncbi:MAG TPA: TfuA-like protein, partial [Polyangiaceae bacterium]
MSIVVFAGPTLRQEEVKARLDAVVLGPAAFGDVYRAAHSRPTAIAIIDGYFERVPAIWHKEILWAMSEGVHVFGASSMGALRAAELYDFGMVGVGSIFEAFRDGTLEDDDEVAVAHGQADTGFLPVSEAMVNIRATLERAAREGVAAADSCARLVQLAKHTFYAQRCYPTLFEAAQADGVPAAELARLRSWLREGGRVDQKRRDAEQLLEHLQRWQQQQPGPLRVSYAFEQTDAWHEAQRIATKAMTPEAQSDDQGVLDELKLTGAYAAARATAEARGWSLEAARRAGVRPDALSVRTAVETFRRNRGLLERQAF